tara:strand:- start:208 stop:399 length:192 start_codon:yes stop_codon:yes gene_type:complete
MASVNIDGKEYDIDSLSDKAKANIASLQFVQNEINRLNGELAVYKTAQVAYTKVVQNEISDDN